MPSQMCIPKSAYDPPNNSVYLLGRPAVVSSINVFHFWSLFRDNVFDVLYDMLVALVALCHL